ncbi:MAG TPA: carboxypeptidase-like regulatory domain-containing protein, partial [Brumimicrobium sp.]|nr:carboxypeptidase-like regulatory domain-containing protein [Brumimicrobium sp.]
MKNYAKNFSLYLYASIVILFLSNYTLGQTASFVGKVQDNFKEPLPFATIKIPQLSLGANADGFGNFKLENISAGKYKVVVYLNGYIENSRTITFVDNEQVELVFTLELEDLIDGVEVF